MPLRQLLNSLHQITVNPHIDPLVGISRHLVWQFRKLFNLFPVELKLSESRLIATHKNCGVSALVNNQGLYDFNNMTLIKTLLQEGGIFLDIGANIGSYTLIASEQPLATVHSLEPHPVTFQYLQNNVAINNRANVFLYNLAAGQENNRIFMTDRPGSAFNRIVDHNQAEAIPVQSVRMHDFCQQQGISPDIVKIDVEGFELNVLSGFGPLLGRIKLLLLELRREDSGHSAKAVITLLRSAGLGGPLFYDHLKRSFQSMPISSEDSVFVNESYQEELSLRGFTFST